LPFATHQPNAEPAPINRKARPTLRKHFRRTNTNRPSRLTDGKQGKAFFFEKKKQKAFIGADADSSGKVCVSADKSFLVLFLEKGLLAFYESRSRPIGISRYLSCITARKRG
jgi:hypothetical protein